MKKLTATFLVFLFTGAMALAQDNEAEVKQLADDGDATINQNGSENVAYIEQNASDNDHTQIQTGLSEEISGSGNYAQAVSYASDISGMQVQFGTDNTSRLNQAASNSSANTFQAGSGHSALIRQNGGSEGYNNNAVVFQGIGSYGEYISLGEMPEVGGYSSDLASMIGSPPVPSGISANNTIGVDQTGNNNTVVSFQVGSNNTAGSNWWNDPGINQEGNGNTAVLGQLGFSNTASISQLGNSNTATVLQNGFGAR